MRGKWGLILASLLLGAIVSAQQIQRRIGESKGIPKVSITVTGNFLNALTGEIEWVTLKPSKDEEFPPAPWEPLIGEIYEVTVTVLSPASEGLGKPKVFKFPATFDRKGHLKLGKASVVEVNGEEWRLSLTLSGQFLNAITGEIEETTVQVTDLGWSEPWEPLVDEVYVATLTIAAQGSEGASAVVSEQQSLSSSVSFRFFVKFESSADGLDVNVLLSTDGKSWHVDVPTGHYKEWDISARTERDEYGGLWVVIYGINTRTGERREFGRFRLKKPYLGAMVVTARKGEDGKPRGGATVVVYERNKEGNLVEVGQKVTDEKGVAHFALKAGEYVVDISYPMPMRCHWQKEVKVRRGDVTEIEFALYQHHQSDLQRPSREPSALGKCGTQMVAPRSKEAWECIHRSWRTRRGIHHDARTGRLDNRGQVHDHR